MSNDRFASAHEMVREYKELEKQMAPEQENQKPVVVVYQYKKND